MARFEVGDKVLRVSIRISFRDHMGMRVGDKSTVIRAVSETGIRLSDFDGIHMASYFKKIL